MQDGRQTPKVNCIHCGKEVSLPELRVHDQEPALQLTSSLTHAKQVTLNKQMLNLAYKQLMMHQQV